MCSSDLHLKSFQKKEKKIERKRERLRNRNKDRNGGEERHIQKEM